MATSSSTFYPFLPSHNSTLQSLYHPTSQTQQSHSHSALTNNHQTLQALLTTHPTPQPSTSLQFLLRTYLLYREPICTRILQQPPLPSIYTPFDITIIHLILHLSTTPKSHNGTSRKPVIAAFDPDIILAMCARFPTSSMRTLLETRSGDEVRESREKMWEVVEKLKDKEWGRGRGEMLSDMRDVGEIVDGIERATEILGRWGGKEQVDGLCGILDKVLKVEKGAKGSKGILMWVKVVERAMRRIMEFWVGRKRGGEVVRGNRRKDVEETVEGLLRCRLEVMKRLLEGGEVVRRLREWKEDWSVECVKRLEDRVSGRPSTSVSL
eukprot:Plantae.Rhodophyta-Hildenbrandia_rubra.ctg5461.p1 GENE.Plantae.Rhodophyta-Hildenbrandia_rubra.ctg5461~~Plantae.Rhodophyta-Hildenbrandia_rubra.ctg5461.p1  ORF type:complete len:324 (-),score=48.62 Plantae.Rhodophyta-Hildenbrandia_rubra.ctg5461:52-1023(-)